MFAFAKSSNTNALGFNAGKIIDDNVFTYANDMSIAEIQHFLDSKNSVCLKNYVTQEPLAGNNYGANVSAAHAIWKAGQLFGINPKVLLVTLQKEQGLITRTDCPQWRYQTALGYGCPDTAPCSTFGFSVQLYQGARHFRGFFDQNAGWYIPYTPGVRYIQYSPNPDCGGSNVTIQNRATASLYSYTPYQPNQAALNAGYGEAPCGAYGNRNFWLYYNQWFGSTYGNDTLSPHPDGALVALDNRVFLIDNQKKRVISNGYVFESYYKWSEIKRGTMGDRNLEDGVPLDVLNPGKLFRSAKSGVYYMNWESPVWRKKMLSYTAFNSLGYSWEEIQVIPESMLASIPLSSSIHTEPRHPNGTLVQYDGNVYMLDHNTRRHVGPHVYGSFAWPWKSVKPATAIDKSLTQGARYLYKEGVVLHANSNLYVIDIPSIGFERKSPIGPWSCFSSILDYSLKDALYVPGAALPTETIQTTTCL